MKSKIKICFWGVVFLVLYVIINYYYIQHIYNSKQVYQSGEEYVERVEYIYTPHFWTASDYVEQPFRPERNYLKEIWIMLGAPYSEPPGEYIVRLELVKDDICLHSEEVILHAEDNWQYFTWNIDKKVSPDKEYSIRVHQAEGLRTEAVPEQFQLAFRPFHAAEHVSENMPYYYFNGEEQQGEFDLCYIYEAYNTKQIGIILGANMLLVLGIWGMVLLRKKMSDKCSQLIGRILWWIFPVFVYIACENILGNFPTILFKSHITNLVIYYIIWALMIIVFNNQRICALTYSLFFGLLTLTQFFVTEFRGKAILLHDIFAIETSKTVVGSYVFYFSETVYAVLLLWLFLLVCTCLFHGAFSLKRKMRYIGFAGVGLSVLILVHTTGIWMMPVNAWDVARTYAKAGNVVTLLSQIPEVYVSEPKGYSVERVKEIASRYAPGERKDTIIPQTIILIMNESFSDLEVLNHIPANEELLPYWDELKENCIKGYTYVPSFGAGTSNSEYEALTGNAMNFLPPGSVPYQINVKDEEKGLVSTLKDQGYHATALHPYVAESWNRLNVYEDMGFEEFYSENNWGELDILRWCASDSSAYEKVIELDGAGDEKQFFFLVTMQNHGGYELQWEDFTNEISLGYEKSYPEAEQYLSLMQESDRAFNNLLEYYEQVEERTMIILFGDHQAAIEDGFYEEIYGKPVSELTFEEIQSRYITPFVIWTNYDIEEQSDVCISTNYLGSLILQEAGLKMPAYNRFLLELMKEIPVIGMGGVKLESDGAWYSMGKLPEEYMQWIQEYEILQYNNVYDKKNRVDDIFSIMP